VCTIAGSAFADTEPTMQDLLALDKQHQWSELLAKADRVHAASRTQDWERLVRTAAARVVEQLGSTESSDWQAARKTVAVVPEVEQRYPFVQGDQAYRNAKVAVLRRAVALCTHESVRDCAAVLEVLADGVDRFPKGVAKDMAFIVDSELGHIAAVRFFALAAEDDSKICEHGLLSRAVLDGLRRGSDAQVAAAQRAAATCYAALELELVRELDDKDETYSKHVCPVLKTHGAMTVAKKRRCP
jgi:hypothetical protein